MNNGKNFNKSKSDTGAGAIVTAPTTLPPNHRRRRRNDAGNHACDW
jgi:hypothetical protein